MENKFVANGEERLIDGESTKNLAAARAKYADEWAKANFLKRIQLRFQIWREAKRQKETHKPSPGTLW
jgi:hypothetical protein